MEIKLKKNKPAPIDDKVTVPVTKEMKRDIEQLKNVIEVNKMSRDYFEELIKKSKADGLIG